MDALCFFYMVLVLVSFFFVFFFCKESWPQHQQREYRDYRLNNGAEYYQHTPNPIDNEELPYTDRFTYLGSIISGDGRTELDIHSRFNKTRNSLNTMNKVWRSSNYSTRTKLCETLSQLRPKKSEKYLSQLSIFHTRSVRRMLRIFWPNLISK